MSEWKTVEAKEMISPDGAAETIFRLSSGFRNREIEVFEDALETLTVKHVWIGDTTKTVKISELKEVMNNYLAYEHLKIGVRVNAAGLFRSILSSIGVYNGFTFLPSEADIHTAIYDKQGKIKFD